jgi:tyrosine aminotransferase
MDTPWPVAQWKPERRLSRSKVFKVLIYLRYMHVDHPFTENDVCLSFGCSGAIYNAVAVLCEPGDSLIVPRPGFPLALPICQNLGVTIKYYDLLPDKNWEIDLESLRAGIDGTTKAILVNNPSNPCGSVFSKEHQLEILKIADEAKVPIISDEVYYDLVYDGVSEFHSFGNLTKDVPVIVRNILYFTNALFSAAVPSRRPTASQVGD